MEMNEVLEKLPKHLLDFVIEQPYNLYSAQDHAVWRYVMRRNVKYLSRVAHESYLDGLKATGISIDYIPTMYGMNRILKALGWAAAAVDGFIPPSAFMEFQAFNVLVIAADIRPISQIEYTPAPDIIHEAAGHAPIIANPEYSEYLRKFGYYGSRAFSSSLDYKIYEAIRHLSILKADPYTPQFDIAAAELHLSKLEKLHNKPSEMCKLRNLHWWTVEFGLIGDLKNPKIYGAGLLSSIGESINCLKDNVKKIPYTIDAVNFGFDITTQQPHLFVTPDFDNLNYVLEQYAETMALRRGGLYGINKAIESENTSTVVYSSGIQISGTFSDVITLDDNPIYIKTKGPTTLNYGNKLLTGHSKNYHKDGFSAPVGKLKNCTLPIELMSDSDLRNIGINLQEYCNLEFESGITVSGFLKSITRMNDKIIIMTFGNCTVKHYNKLLFKPEWGIYDMAVGESIVSVFSGPADPNGFELTFNPPEEKTHKIHHSESAIKLHSLYKKARDIRESGKGIEYLSDIWQTIKSDYENDWLLPIEILELCKNDNSYLKDEITNHLNNLKSSDNSLSELIANGLELIEN